MVATPLAGAKKLSRVEGLKERSNYLREPVATELLQDTTHFSEDAVQILKFHGSYQQDNRDNRRRGEEKDYRMMLRTRSPGGQIPAQLYLALDRLADEYGNGTLRATTRQGFQLHGILKKNLKATVGAIVRAMGSTLGACGDLNRNVMAPPAPYKNRPEYGLAWEYADKVADLLTPQTGAYYEIWLDGEKIVSGEEDPAVRAARERNGNGTIFHDSPEEPIYGTNYMPRKFKCCVTVPGDNSVDLFTQDVTLVVIADDSGELQGFNIYVGGGLGRTHNKEETFARTADSLGYVAKDDVYDLIKAIVATQRDYGDRTQRRHARMKYLLHDWGVAKFKTQVEQYFGKEIAPAVDLLEWKYQDYLGWHEQGDGNWFLGLNVENGRVKDEGPFQLKSALRQIVERFDLPMRLTPNHNIILHEIAPAQRAEVDRILGDCGVISDPAQVDGLTRVAMACPALPLCGLAVTESERILPSILSRLRGVLDKVGLQDEAPVVRMTGCPNGCARPYMAEIGFVGSAPNAYQVWLGGTPNQTQLAAPIVERLPEADIESFFEPLFAYFKQARATGESFGEFCARVGFEALTAFSENYTPIASKTDKRRRFRISVYDGLHQRLKDLADRQGKTMTQLAAEALEAYLASEEGNAP